MKSSQKTEMFLSVISEQFASMIMKVDH